MIRLLRAFLALALLIASPAPVLAQSMQFTAPSAARVPYVSGRYYAFEGPETVTAGGATSAGALRILPVVVRQPVTLSSLVVRVTTLSASGNFQLLIYDSDPATGDPTGAPLYQSANQSTASVATIEVASVNKALVPGKVYWIGVQVDTNGASAVFAAPNNNNTFFVRGSGVSTAALAGTTSSINCMTKSGTFNSPPTLTGSRATDSFTESSSGFAPYVTFKAG
jgi:hypothetical protein